MKVPFVVYTDFESFTEKLNSMRLSKESQYTLGYQKHKPSGFCFLIVSPYFEFEPESDKKVRRRRHWMDFLRNPRDQDWKSV